jgi:flagellar biogenesis protein FliO
MFIPLATNALLIKDQSLNPAMSPNFELNSSFPSIIIIIIIIMKVIWVLNRVILFSECDKNINWIYIIMTNDI